jgi:hypothetical protein
LKKKDVKYFIKKFNPFKQKKERIFTNNLLKKITMAKQKSIVWTTGLVIKTFQLERIYKGFDLLEDLMTVENDLTATDIEMLVAQVHNQDGKPIYGCHVIGELWHFMVMHDNQYAMHKGLNATEPDDLQAILLILRKVKQILMLDLIE